MTQEKRNKVLLLSLVLLTLVCFGFYFFENDDEAIADRSIFRSEDFEAVDSVVLVSPEDTAVVAYNGSRWIVNNTYAADPDMIDVLFATLREAEVKRPVASALRDSISAALEKSGVHVTLFSDERALKSFIAGGNQAKTQAYFKEKGGNEVYLMAIPGYRVYASGIFEIGERGFRSKYVFDFNWRNFKSLKATFPEMPDENFEVAMGKQFFTIQGMASADTAKLNSFLDQVSVLQVDEYGKGTASEIDKPMMVITIDDVASRKYELSIFQPSNGRARGLVNGEVAYFDNRKIQPLLKPRSFFVK